MVWGLSVKLLGWKSCTWTLWLIAIHHIPPIWFRRSEQSQISSVGWWYFWQGWLITVVETPVLLQGKRKSVMLQQHMDLLNVLLIDITGDECNRCLRAALDQYDTECNGKPLPRAYLLSCQVRFELFPTSILLAIAYSAQEIFMVFFRWLAICIQLVCFCNSICWLQSLTLHTGQLFVFLTLDVMTHEYLLLLGVSYKDSLSYSTKTI